MANDAILIMEKNSETGILEKEIGSYSLRHDIKYLNKAFVMEENGQKSVFLYLTVPGEFEDWEYNAILDSYDTEIFNEKVLSFEEDEDSYNPGWIAKISFIEDDDIIEGKLNEILELHFNETVKTLELIKGLESEYK